MSLRYIKSIFIINVVNTMVKAFQWLKIAAQRLDDTAQLSSHVPCIQWPFD